MNMINILSLNSFLHRPWWVLLLWFGLLCSNQTLAGNLTASVDKDTLGLNETFVLTLRYDEQVNAAPDYTLLEKDFDILNTQSGNYMSLVNGRAESYTQWIIALAPRKIGIALIPSFNINGAISDAIQITVEGKSAKSQDNIVLNIQVDKTQVFVQQQLLVTLRLTTYVDLTGANSEELKIKDALIVQVDNKNFRNVTNGRESITYETTYAVFPQTSGELIIPSVLYQVEVADNSRNYMDFFARNRGNLLRLRTDEQRISVSPTPNDPKAQPWLPAKDIRIEEHWSSSPDNLKVGEPITRTLTIKADGLSAGQLPPLAALDIQGLSAYQDQAQNDDQKSERGITGSRIETTAIVANQPGTFTLPEIKLHWWDTDEQQFKTATLAPSTLSVGGIAALQPDQQEAAENISVPMNTDLNSLPAQTLQIPAKTPWWMYAILLVSLIVNIVLGIAYWQVKRRIADQRDVKEYFANESAHHEKDAWKQLREALVTTDLVKIRRAIINWGKLFWNDEQLSTLDTLARKFNSQEFKAVCDDIDAAIFGNKPAPVVMDKLLELLANLRKATRSTTKEPLDKLYP